MSATKHLALEKFEPIDMSLGDPITPFGREGDCSLVPKAGRDQEIVQQTPFGGRWVRGKRTSVHTAAWHIVDGALILTVDRV